MANLIRKSVSVLGSQSFKSSARLLIGSGVKDSHFPSRAVTLSRSIWCLASNNSSSRTFRHKTALKTCSHCELHTEADQELVNFIKEEIENEKKLGVKKVSTIEGWDIETSGSEVTLQRKSGDETLTVKMNVNNSVHAEEQGEEEQAQSMVSRPPFEVNIKKASGKIISFQCDFYDADDHEFDEVGAGKEQQDTGVGDLFNINEVSIHAGEMKDSDYYMSAENMDATMYDLFMDMLDERGVSNNFITRLVEFTTSYEHDQYVNFLEKLDSVVKEK